MLLGQVAALFQSKGERREPRYQPETDPPIPRTVSDDLPGDMGTTSNRRVFRCVLHQSSKHREFLTGLLPDVRPGTAPGSFRITEGSLYKASQHALQVGHAALLIIDEINRGPTVQVFGGSIVALETEKRLDGEERPTERTEFFDLLDPETGDFVEYALPSRLYLLAAMNQADVSVEPLDVAFLRRWTPVRLEPTDEVLRDHFGQPSVQDAALPSEPRSPADVVEAAVRAFGELNERIALGRGEEYRIGHGLLMAREEIPSTVESLLDHFATAWRSVKNHIDEVFFGDVRGAAVVLKADRALPGNPYVLEETTFGDRPRAFLRGPSTVTRRSIYGLLVAVGGKET